MMAKAELKTNNTRILIRTGFDQPHGIAVYPQKGYVLLLFESLCVIFFRGIIVSEFDSTLCFFRYLFWTEWSVEPKLERSDLLGNNRMVLVDTNLENPTGVAVDFDNDRYFPPKFYFSILSVCCVQNSPGASNYGVRLIYHLVSGVTTTKV